MRRSRRPGAQRLLVGVPGLRHSSASLSSVRARLIRLLTVPLGMPSSAAASRVVRPSRTVAWTTACRSGERRAKATPDVAVLDPGQHLLLGRRRPGGCAGVRSRSITLARGRSWCSSDRTAMPQSQAATSPSPRHPAACARRRGRCPGRPCRRARVGAAPGQPGRQPRLVAHEELAQRTTVGRLHGVDQLARRSRRRTPLRGSSRRAPLPSRLLVAPRPMIGSPGSPRRAPVQTGREPNTRSRTHLLVAARSVRRTSSVMEEDPDVQDQDRSGGGSRPCSQCPPPRWPQGCWSTTGTAPRSCTTRRTTRSRRRCTPGPATGDPRPAHGDRAAGRTDVRARTCTRVPAALTRSRPAATTSTRPTRRSRSPSGRSGSTSPRTNAVEGSPRPRCRGRSRQLLGLPWPPCSAPGRPVTWPGLARKPFGPEPAAADAVSVGLASALSEDSGPTSSSAAFPPAGSSLSPTAWT